MSINYNSNKFTYTDVIKTAINALRNPNGSSTIAIKKWILANYSYSGITIEKLNRYIYPAIKRCIAKGELIKIRNSFKLNKNEYPYCKVSKKSNNTKITNNPKLPELFKVPKKPTFRELIISAILSLNQRIGSSIAEINKWILANNKGVNPKMLKIHSRIARNRMIACGIIVIVRRSYKLSENSRKKFRTLQKKGVEHTKIINIIAYNKKISSKSVKSVNNSNNSNNSKLVVGTTKPIVKKVIISKIDNFEKVLKSVLKVSCSYYQHLTVKSIHCLNERNGISLYIINKWCYANIPEFSKERADKMLRLGVKPLLELGILVKIKNSYKINRNASDAIIFDSDRASNTISYKERLENPFVIEVNDNLNKIYPFAKFSSLTKKQFMENVKNNK